MVCKSSLQSTKVTNGFSIQRKQDPKVNVYLQAFHFSGKVGIPSTTTIVSFLGLTTDIYDIYDSTNQAYSTYYNPHYNESQTTFRGTAASPENKKTTLKVILV